MSRTRSGLLDRIDLTDIKDSEEEDNGVDAVYSDSDQPQSLEEAQQVVVGKASILRSVAANENKKGKGISAPAINITAKQNSQVGEGSVGPSLIENSTFASTPTKNYGNNDFESPVSRPVVPFVSPEPITNGNNNNDDKDEDDDAIEIIGESNPGTNPLLDFPHRREDCQRFCFASHPERFCRLCFCYICDIPASECAEWNFVCSAQNKQKRPHCLARHSDAKSRLKRRSVQIRKTTLRPRKKRIPSPQRLRSSPENSTRTKNASRTKPSKKKEPTISSRPQPSMPMPIIRTEAFISSRTPSSVSISGAEASIISSRPQSSVPISRTLRSRKRLLPPIRLRSPEYVSEFNKQSEGTKSSISSPPPPSSSASRPISRTFHHDLFLPGRAKQPNVTMATTEATKTTQINRCRGSLSQSTSLSFRKKNSGKVPRTSTILSKTKPSRSAVLAKMTVVRAHRAVKKARQIDAPSRRRRIQFSMKQKRESTTTSSPKVTIEDAPTKSPSISATKRPMATTSHSKTTKPSTRSSHYTRSSNSTNSTNAVKTEEIFGTLGAYWRGQRTKYAGVPYRICTTKDNNNNNNNTRRGTTAIPKTEIKPLTSRSNIAGKATTFSPHQPRDMSKNLERPRIQKRRILSPFSSTRIIGTAAAATVSEESQASTPKMMPELSNHKRGVGPTSINNAPDKETITATLEGTIAFDSNSRRYSMLGRWHCPLSKSFPPQKFGLVRSLRGREEGPEGKRSSMNGIFDGYCVVTTMSLDAKGHPSYRDRLVFEKHIKLEFKSPKKGGGNTNRGTLEVWGSGANKFGPFVIHGMARPYTSEKNSNILYTMVLQKRYLPNTPLPNKHKNTELPNRPLTNKPQNTVAAASRVHETLRPTRSNSVHGNGTIVRKKFGNGTYCEGEVTGYDPVQKYYTIKYTDGNHDVFDEADMMRYYKHLQRYSNAPYPPKALAAREVREKLLYSKFVDNSILTRIK